MHDLNPASGTIPWRYFKQFIAPAADRFAIIKSILEETAVDYSVLQTAESRHFIVSPSLPEQIYLRHPPIVLVAHYDRAEGSPGANDNSVGVFMLLETAFKLKSDSAKNWIIIFTDKEELKPGESIQSQGSYSLAEKMKKSMLENAKIFSFDACGTGDTIIISNTVEYLLKQEGGGDKLLESVMELRKIALDTATNLRISKVLLAPTPFSDDVGFFRAGLAAQTVTMLPSAECERLVTELRRHHYFTNTIISAEFRKAGRIQFIPKTWSYLNTPGDSYLRLTPQHFRIVTRFAEALCKA